MAEFAIREGRWTREPLDDFEWQQWCLYLKEKGAVTHARECVKRITDEGIRTTISAILDE